VDDDEPLWAELFSPERLEQHARSLAREQLVSDRAPLTWSDDDARVFFGMKAQVPAPPTGEKKTTDEQADVDVWNTADERLCKYSAKSRRPLCQSQCISRCVWMA